MSVLSFVAGAVLYTVRYFVLVYLGKHVTGVLYGEDADESSMAWPWRILHKKFKEAPKVVVVSCMDARLVAFGQLFLHAYMYWVARQVLGKAPIIYGVSGAGPSVSCDEQPGLAHAHRQSITEGAKTAHAAMVIVTGHEHCARDTRPNNEKANGILALRDDIIRELSNVIVLAYFLDARILGWSPRSVTHLLPTVDQCAEQCEWQPTKGPVASLVST